MKQLILIRHAKADSGDAATDDHERPLNSKGRRAATEMGMRLSERGLVPDGVFTSTALRARSTTELLAVALGYPLNEIMAVPELYHAGVGTLLDFIAGLDEKLGCVMCCGHNPGLTELAHYEFGCQVGNVPTCGVVNLEFSVNAWPAVQGTRPVNMDFNSP